MSSYTVIFVFNFSRSIICLIYLSSTSFLTSNLSISCCICLKTTVETCQVLKTGKKRIPTLSPGGPGGPSLPEVPCREKVLKFRTGKCESIPSAASCFHRNPRNSTRKDTRVSFSLTQTLLLEMCSSSPLHLAFRLVL